MKIGDPEYMQHFHAMVLEGVTCGLYDRVDQLESTLLALARLSLQSNRYVTDAEFRQFVDLGLALTQRETAHENNSAE